MAKQKKVRDNRSPEEIRRELEDAMKVYLDSGKKIEQIPTGVSGIDERGGRKHIVLGPAKGAESKK